MTNKQRWSRILDLITQAFLQELKAWPLATL
jgi:hypothetical protein